MNNTRILIPGRLSYVHVFKPHASFQGQEPKYSTTILIPKTDTKTKANIDAAILAAEQLGLEKSWNGTKPPVVPNPLWDGDGVKLDGTEFGPECKGHWVITASAKAEYPPQVVDQQVQPILDHTKVYSGMYANVMVSFFPYAYAGKKGIGAGLSNIQKTADGESLAGLRTAEQDFKVIESGDNFY